MYVQKLYRSTSDNKEVQMGIYIRSEEGVMQKYLFFTIGIVILVMQKTCVMSERMVMDVECSICVYKSI